MRFYGAKMIKEVTGELLRAEQNERHRLAAAMRHLAPIHGGTRAARRDRRKLQPPARTRARHPPLPKCSRTPLQRPQTRRRRQSHRHPRFARWPCLPIGADAADEPASEHITTPASEETGERVSVLVVDDHQAVREGLKRLLQEQPALEIVGEAVDGIEVVELARRLHPNAILMDINMPRMNGIDATRAITPEFPDTTVIGFSIREDEDARQAMADAGAKAFFTKGAPVQVVCEVLLTHCV